MIVAAFYQQGDFMIGEISGHAGYAEAGKDIVCAAASILAFSLAEGLEREQKRGGLQSLMIHRVAGKMRVSFSPNPEKMESVAALIEGIVIGFELLSQKFPEFVRLKMKEKLFLQKT